jgi:hypothetical protein
MTVRPAAIVLLLAACASAPPPCEYRDFAVQPSGEHMIESAGPAYVVSAFRGRLTAEGGAWPAQMVVQFEVHGPSHQKLFITVRDDGTFEQSLKPGRYCFKLSSLAMRSYLGTFIVDPVHGEAKPIEITMRWAA